MPWVAAVAAGVVGVVGAVSGANSAEDAANTQAGTAYAGIAEQKRQFDAIQKLLSPYVNVGTPALKGYTDLLGLNGNGAAQSAIDAIKASPQYTSALKTGTDAILANASATGGLRGGNTQNALMEFSPTLLTSLINDRYGQLGNLITLGQNSAVMTGNAGQASTNNVTNLLQQIGAAQAGGILGKSQANASALNGIGSGLGFYAAYNSNRSPAASNTYPSTNDYNYIDSSTAVPGF